MIQFVFDMDGTIVDSFRAVREAYKAAGLKLTEEAWGKTAAEWGCPPEIHTMKERLYPGILRKWGSRMQAAELLEVTSGAILTGAGEAAVQAVRDFLEIDFPLAGAGCDHEEKIRVLLTYPKDVTVYYVDDDRDFGLRVLREVPNALFLEVARHEGVYHLYNKKGEVQRWTLSSWLPDVTIV